MPRAHKATTAATKQAPIEAPASQSGAKAQTKAQPKAPSRRSGSKSAKSPFLETQSAALLEERTHYLRQAEELKAEADSLALEHEPGDVQFDEEGGEGGTSNVDRELDLALSAQARAAIEEIDRALAKIQAGTYGVCERCGQPIAEARLEALPHAALCVACKSGGLSSRR
ncbi:MAG: TraR/DksA C4-type zinc finger protein [Actinomycetota bacterium]|jgi:DnaK suppressor protein|nr:TraR/DksA C4-type zinc finger protein [Actinomycetota bacterium]